MNVVLFISILFGLQFFYWLIGRYASRNSKNQEDYFLAGKSVRFFPLMMTFLATQVGGGVVLGAADEAYRFGWPVLLYPLGAAFGLILLGCGIGRRLAGFQVSTVAQIFEVVYGSKMLRKVASLLSVASLFMILVAQMIASHKFLLSLGVSSSLLFVLFWAIVIVYTAQGGLKAVISTDMAQAAFFSVIFLGCFALVFFGESGVAMLSLPSADSFLNVSSKWCGWLLMPLLFMVIEQDMGQRCFAGASPKVVSKASFWAGVMTLIICVVPVFLGTLAKSMSLEIPKGGSVLMAVVAATTHPWVAALVGCAVLSAIVSTATSLINAISSNLSSDFQLPSFQKFDFMRFIKVVTSLISVAAIFFAFYLNNIVDLLIQSYELSVCALFVPIFMALLRRQGSLRAATVSILLGVIGFFGFRLYPLGIPKEVATILLALMGYGVVEAKAMKDVLRRVVDKKSSG